MVSKSPQLAARRISDPPVRVIALFGDHDLSTLSDLEQALSVAVDSGDPVIVDLQRATFADSTILGALINAHNHGRGRFAIVTPLDGEVARLFDLVDATSILVTFPALRVAIDWCHPAASRRASTKAPRSSA